MNNKVIEIIKSLVWIEERANVVGFDRKDALEYTKLIKELKLECDVSEIDCREMIKLLDLAAVGHTSLMIIS